MLKFTIAASLLAMTLSVDAFAGKPDQEDQTEKTTATRLGQSTTQELRRDNQEFYKKIRARAEQSRKDSERRFEELSREAEMSAQSILSDYKKNLETSFSASSAALEKLMEVIEKKVSQ